MQNKGEIFNVSESWKEGYTGGKLKIGALIASEISRLVCLEMEIKIKSGGSFWERFYRSFLYGIRRHIEYACASGGVMFKPFYENGELGVDTVLPDAFKVLGCDSGGNIVSAAFRDEKIYEDRRFMRIENHIRTTDGYTITNEAYCKDKGYWMPVMLCETPFWQDFDACVEIDGMREPLFAYFRMPQGSVKDISSPLGAAVYANAAELIAEAELQFERLLWEYEGGQLAIDASEDAFRRDSRGHAVLPQGRERLFRMNKFTSDDVSASGTDLFRVFAPPLRDDSYKNGLEFILRRIEDACGLSHGTVSSLDSAPRTATEIKMYRQRTYTLVFEIQSALEAALRCLAISAHALASLYLIPDAPASLPSLDFSWGDSISSAD